MPPQTFSAPKRKGCSASFSALKKSARNGWVRKIEMVNEAWGKKEEVGAFANIVFQAFIWSK